MDHVAPDVIAVTEAHSVSNGYRRYVTVILLLLVAVNFMDRTILSTIGVAVKTEIGMTDTELGLLQGLAFTTLYSILAVPVARFADRVNRVNIMSFALVIWSCFTIAGSAAQTVVQFALARCGVGIGEAGASAPLQSLIADYFKPEQRTGGGATIALGIPVGTLLGALFSGWVTSEFGWRWALVGLGVPGILLGIVMKLTVREPVRGTADYGGIQTATRHVPIPEVIRDLVRHRYFVHMIAGSVIASFGYIGMVSFVGPFFARQFGFVASQLGVVIATVFGVGMGIGLYAGGRVTDRLVLRSAGWIARSPGIALVAMPPILILGYTASDWRVALALIAIASAGMFYLAPTFATLQNILGPRSRATGAALTLLVINLLASGLGPVAVGFMIDMLSGAAFSGAGGSDYSVCHQAGGAPAMLRSACATAIASGTRMTLIASTGFFLWGGIHFIVAAKWFPPRLEQI